MSITYGITATEQSQSLDQLFAALSTAFGQLRNAPRTCTGEFGKYADLATLLDTAREPLAANGLSVIQTFMPWSESGQMALVTTLGHKSGQMIRSVLPIAGGLEPQRLAATATYMRRIELAAILGIAAEDEDDGRTANAEHAVAAVNEEREVERKATLALKAKATAEDRKVVMDEVARRVAAGALTPEAQTRLQAVCDSLDAKQDAAKPRQQKKELVAAT
jgi:hypothetical protein